MDEENLNKLTDNIKDKVGEEVFATISDDISEIINGNNQNLATIENSNTKIAELTKRNEDLVTANGNLFKRIPLGKNEDDIEERKPKKVNIASLFDGKGHFKKKL